MGCGSGRAPGGAHHRWGVAHRQPGNARKCAGNPAGLRRSPVLRADAHTVSQTPLMSADGNPIRPLIAGNWKMHGRRSDGAALAGELVRQARRNGGTELRCELAICPPATLLTPLADLV